MNQLYPAFIKLRGRFCLVVGGGEIAAWKTRGLREAGAAVTVVSPALVPELLGLQRSGRIRWVAREFQESDLDGQFLVIAATDDPDVSARVFEGCEQRGILCNAVDQDEFCSFHVPAIAAREDIKVAISTAGKSPAFAADLRRRVQDLLTERDARLVRGLGRLRPLVHSRHPDDPERRKEIFQGVVGAFRRKEASRAQAAHRDRTGGGWICRRAERGTVYLVGAGPGDAGLITARGLELIESADVVFYDRLVGPDVLERIGPAAERVYVGKKAGHGGRPDTASLLVGAARRGQSVVRLKGGDPNLFGRGGEEALALLRADVRFEVVPGVSALTAVPSAAGIPLTCRGISHEVVVRTGYRLPDPAANRLSPGDPAQTTYVYFMTVGRLSEIVTELIESDGLAVTTPIAIIQRGTLPQQQVIRGRLGDILAHTSQAPLRPPALVVVGEVVHFADRDDLLSFLERGRHPIADPQGGPHSPAEAPLAVPQPAGGHLDP